MGELAPQNQRTRTDDCQTCRTMPMIMTSLQIGSQRMEMIMPARTRSRIDEYPVICTPCSLFEVRQTNKKCVWVKNSNQRLPTRTWITHQGQRPPNVRTIAHPSEDRDIRLKYIGIERVQNVVSNHIRISWKHVTWSRLAEQTMGKCEFVHVPRLLTRRSSLPLATNLRCRAQIVGLLKIL